MTQEEYQQSIEREIKGSEAGVRKMLMYYISALKDAGIEDINQYIATKMAEMIQLSEEQLKFVLVNFNNENKLVDNLQNSIQLLTAMKDKKKLDLESLEIVIKVLNLILEDYNNFDLDS